MSTLLLFALWQLQELFHHRASFRLLLALRLVKQSWKTGSYCLLLLKVCEYGKWGARQWLNWQTCAPSLLSCVGSLIPTRWLIYQDELWQILVDTNTRRHYLCVESVPKLSVCEPWDCSHCPTEKLLCGGKNYWISTHFSSRLSEGCTTCQHQTHHVKCGS